MPEVIRFGMDRPTEITDDRRIGFTAPEDARMCNLFASTMPQDAMRSLFDVAPENDHLGNLAPLRAIFPRHDAPMVRRREDGARELVPAHWGFVLPQTSKRTGEPIMPAILTPADHAAWMEAPPEEALALIRPHPAERMAVVGVGEGMKSELADLFAGRPR